MLAPPAENIVAEVRTFEALRQLLRARTDALNISRETLDEIAGLTSGHSSKLLAPTPIKKLGDVTLPLLLGALGLRLLLVEDAEQLARLRSRLTPRQANAVRASACLWGGKARITVSKRWVKRIAREGGRARARALSPAQRSKIAKRAAVIRWAVRATIGGPP